MPKSSNAGNIHVKRPKVTRARIDEKPESPNNCKVTRARFDEKPESSSNANVTRARLDEKTESASNTEEVKRRKHTCQTFQSYKGRD